VTACRGARHATASSAGRAARAVEGELVAAGLLPVRVPLKRALMLATEAVAGV
jgi:hypothetical protein